MNVFEYENYKKYLRNIFTVEGKGRGGRTQLAKYIGCQSGFISHILNGDVNFSLEQTIKLSRFLELDEEQADYLMLLVQRERAGSVDLSQFFQSKIDQIQKARKEVKERIRVDTELDEKDYLIYYGHWYFSAIHIATTVPELQSIEKIAQKLSLSKSLVKKVLNFLVSKGLVEESKGRFSIGKARIHIDRQSPLFIKHHTNWHIESIKALDKESDEGLHYSGVISLSREDIQRIREILLKSIEKSEEILIKSPEETLATIAIDFFEL